MRPVKVRPRWRCDFCRHTSSQVSAMEAHERRCWNNPDRYCDSCDNQGSYPEDYFVGACEPCFFCSQRRDTGVVMLPLAKS